MATPIIDTASSSEPKIRKKRNKNFSTEEENLIQSMVEEHVGVLTSTFNNEVTIRQKNAIWQDITQAVNSKCVSVRTTEQVKEKWGQMVQKAKKKFTDYRKNQRTTGGGSAPPEVSQATANIIENMKDTASFSGVPGEIASGRTSTQCSVSVDTAIVDTEIGFSSPDASFISAPSSPITSTAVPGTSSGCLPNEERYVPLCEAPQKKHHGQSKKRRMSLRNSMKS